MPRTPVKNEYPLSGIKVANFSWIGVGPMTMRYLAHWGATVVRVESHLRLDNARVFLPFKDGKPGINRSGMYAALNNSVLGITINMNQPTGLDIAWRLIKWADVVAESFTPGTMAKWGLDYESVRKLRPDIVYFSTTQNGQTGPLSSVAGFGIQAMGVAGFTNISGWPDRDPSPTQGAYTDYISPRLAAAAVMAALDRRRRTGKGQHIDQAQLETGVQFLAPVIMDYTVNGRVMGRNGNRIPAAAPHGVYPCRGDDRWCAIEVTDDREWLAFRMTLGNPAWAAEERFATLTGRKLNEDELDSLVSAWTADYPAEQVETIMQAAGIAAGVVESNKDLYQDAHLKAQNFFRPLNHTELGPIAIQGPMFTMSKSPDHQFAPPGMGEHNEYVFKELLKMTDDEVADALASGGITTDADLPEIRAAF